MLALSVYCALIVVASMLGGKLPALVTLTHNRLQLLISFVGGMMLGIALFHLLPHAVRELGAAQLDAAMSAVMTGLVAMFFLLRMFHFHHHEPTDAYPRHDHDHDHDHAHDHSHDHSHDHDGGTAHGHGKQVHELSWLGVFIGLSVHTLIDGMALGASLQADANHGTGAFTMGLGTFVAILLHKPLDALSVTSLMRGAHLSERFQLFVNGAFAMMCPLGAYLFVFCSELLAEQKGMIVGAALAFSAGVFLCISLSDLLPEMEFHSHNRTSLSMALLAGIGLAWCLRWLEPAGTHAVGLL